eukprot:6529845-Pyramimonas_sp.AAC.1
MARMAPWAPKKNHMCDGGHHVCHRPCERPSWARPPQGRPQQTSYGNVCANQKKLQTLMLNLTKS